MELVAIVIVLAIFEYQFFSIKVGLARGKYDIQAPANTGHPIFERYYRVHQNTLEQLIVFIPAITIYGYFGNPVYAAGLGVIFLVARIIYFMGYVSDPSKRATGFVLGFLPTAVMLIAGLVSVVRNLL